MGFCFNGITSKSLGIPSRMTVENRIPSLRNSTTQISGKDGLVDFGSALSERTIDIECLIPPGKSRAGLLALKDSLTDWLNPSRGVCALTLDTEPGRIYYARLNDGVSFEKVVRRTATFDVSFLCPDPYAYAEEDEEYTLEADGTVTRGLGNVDSHPVYEIHGALSDSSQTLTFSVDGDAVTVCGPLAENETMYIDTDSMTAWIETAAGIVRNALGNIADLNFPHLAVGENTITLESDGGTFSSLTIQARSRWL